MRYYLTRVLALVTLGWVAWWTHTEALHAAAARQSAAAPARERVPDSARPLITRYCQCCHNQRLRTAGRALETADIDAVSNDAELWEKVIRKLRIGAMPPPGLPRPDPQTVEALVSYLRASIDRAAATAPN